MLSFKSNEVGEDQDLQKMINNLKR